MKSMPRARRINQEQSFYHVTSRGNNRMVIFHDEMDYKYFLKILGDYCGKFNIKVHSFALIPNHFHLLLKTEEANLSKFMHSLKNKYAKYYQAKYKFKGHIFERRFWSQIVEAASYGLVLFRYINANAVKHGLVHDPIDWQWSSYHLFVNQIYTPRFMDLNWFIDNFNLDKKRIMTIVNSSDNLSISREKILGSDHFKFNFIKPKIKKKNYSSNAIFEVENKVNNVFSDSGVADKVFMYLLKYKLRMTCREICEEFEERNEKSIRKQIERFEKQLLKDPLLQSVLSGLRF